MVDFDCYLGQIQGCLLRGHRQNVSSKSLSDSEESQELCEKVKKVLKNCPQHYDTRNIYLYLLLNCDSDVIDLIGEDDNFSHLVKTAPSQSQALVLRTILSAGGLPFLKELVTFAPSGLSVFLLETLLSSEFNLESLSECETIAIELSEACYQKLLLSEMENSTILDKFHIFFVTLQTFLLHYNKEDQESSTTCHQGMLLLQNFKLCLLCFEDCMKDRNECWDGFKMKCAFNTEYLTSQENFKVRTHNDILCECKKFMISKCLQLCKRISVMDWMDWAEMDVDSSMTLQQCVGEVAYKLKTKLRSYLQEFPDLQDFLEILSGFAIKPKNEDDDIINATLDDFKASLSSEGKDRRKWIKGLLLQKNLLESEETIQMILSNCALLEDGDVLLLLELITAKLIESNVLDETKEYLKNMSDYILQCLPLENLLKIFSEYVKRYGLSSSLCSKEFNGRLLETFNKSSYGSKENDDNKWQCEFVRLCIQNPSAVVLKAIEIGLEDINVAKKIVSVLVLLQSVSREIILNWADEVLNHSSFHGTQMDVLPTFVTELLKQNLLPRSTFVKTHIFCALHRALDSCDWITVSMWLTVLQHILCDSGIEASELCRVAVLLAYLGQVIEYSQQTVNNFTLHCIATRQKAIGLIQSLKDIHIIELDRDWLSSFISKFSVMTQNHIKIITERELQNIQHETDSLPLKSENCLNAQVKTPETAALIFAQMLPFLIVDEWRYLASILMRRFEDHNDCCYSLFQAFQQAIFLLVAACAGVNFNFEENELACLNYCIRCLGNIIKMDVLPALKTPNFLHVLEETLFLMSKLPNEVWDWGGMYILPVLVTLLEEVLPEYESFTSISTVLSSCPKNQGRVLLENKVKHICQASNLEVQLSESFGN